MCHVKERVQVLELKQQDLMISWLKYIPIGGYTTIGTLYVHVIFILFVLKLVNKIYFYI